VTGARGWIRARLGDARLGTAEYWLRPTRRAPWGGPFNGQAHRRRLFADLCTYLDLIEVVETGTDHGCTTAYLHATAGVPVHSFEIDVRRHAFASTRLRRTPDAHLHLEDSRTGLATLAPSDGPTFFYLDAHADDVDLPLLHEVDLALGRWPRAIVMIDDFAVPGDPGYGFDEALTLDLLGARADEPTAVWFPAAPSRDETGYRRGCVVLTLDTALAERVDAVPALRRWAVAPRPTAERGSAAAAR
jgi:hypothetical protein